MLAGNSSRLTYTAGNPYEPDPPKSDWAALGQVTQEVLSQRALGFNCLHYDAKYDEASLNRHYLPNKTYIDANCYSGVRFELMFPRCWDGRLDSDNHMDHVAYPDLVQTGNCPSTHPTLLPGLFFETIYETKPFVGRPGQYVLGNGDGGKGEPTQPTTLPFARIDTNFGLRKVMDTTVTSKMAGIPNFCRRRLNSARICLERFRTAPSSTSSTRQPQLSAR